MSLPVSLIRVLRVVPLTPHMVRITFTSGGLEPFFRDEPDLQVKLYFPRPGHDVVLPEAGDDLMAWYQAFNAIPENERPWMRSFTLRSHGEGVIDIDFVLHGDTGPATRWAQRARPGDTLGIFGPSPYFARQPPLDESITAADWLLIASDESALPAIGTLLDWLPEGHRAVAYIEVADAAEEQPCPSAGAAAVHWLHRGQEPVGEALLRAVRQADLPEGRVFAWIAGESGTVRALRRHLVDDRGIDKRAIDFAGYWRLKLTQDDAPTAEDLAEADERLRTG
ncbi:siderophore-interacting protein [Nonomuraea africana]|uniref:siderophore-interacting protein n=1 Tax=Nonomuraea africana TaxID=46171 RepID=UPI0033F20F29